MSSRCRPRSPFHSQSLRVVQFANRVVVMASARARSVAVFLLAIAMLPAWSRLLRVCVGAALYGFCWVLLGGFYQYPWQVPVVAARLIKAASVAFLKYVARGCRPKFAEWTLAFEMETAVFRCITTHYSPYMIVDANAKHIQRQGDWMGLVLCSSLYRKPGSQIDAFMYNGLEHIWVRHAAGRTAASPQKPLRRCVLLFIHASAFCMLSPKFFIAMAGHLSEFMQTKLQALSPNETIQVDVLLANYRKAPQFPYPIPPNDTLAMYRYLLDVEHVLPQNIIVGGDSAGAGLALTTLLRIRDENPGDLPCAAILAGPYVDLGARGDDRQVPHCVITNSALETIPQGYVPRGCPKTWGDASPLHCNLADLPPAYVIAGEFDYILPQAQQLVDRARADGATDWQLDIHPHMNHAFWNLPSFILPYARKGLEAMAAYAATKWAASKQQSKQLEEPPVVSASPAEIQSKEPKKQQANAPQSAKAARTDVLTSKCASIC